MLPRADLDVEAALERCGRSATTSATAATRRCSSTTAAVRRRRPAVVAGAAPRRSREALASPRPRRPRRLEESVAAAPGWCTRPQRRTDVTTEVAPGGTRHRALGPGRPGRALRPRRPVAYRRLSVVMNVVPAQVAGVGSLAVASPAAAGLRRRCRTPTILAACALLGIDEVYAVGGAQAIAMFAYGAEPCRAGRRHHRPGQRLRRRGQAAAQGRRRHRLRGRPDRDRDPGRRHRRPGARRRRPDQPGRARPDGRLRAGHRLAAAGRRRRGRARQAGRGDAPRRAHPHRARRRAVRHRPRRRHSTQGLRGDRRLRRRAPRDPDRRRARPVAARVRNAGAVFVGPYAPVSLGDYLAGLQPRAAHRRLRLPLLAGCRCSRSCAASTSSTTTGRRSPRSRRPRRRAADAEDLPAHGAAVRIRSRGAGVTGRPPACRSATTCAGIEPYGAPQLDVPVAAQRQREPLPAVAAAGRRPRARRRGGGGRPQPLPRPRGRPSCARTSRPTWPGAPASTSRPSRSGRPTAPTR